MIHITPVRRLYPLLAAAIVLLLLGAGVAWGVGDALGLSHTPAAVPREDVAAAPRRVAAPAPPLASTVVPDEPRTIKAASAVADALASRGLPRPAVVTPAAPGPTPPATTAAQPVAGAQTPAGRATGPQRAGAAGTAATAAPAGTTAPGRSGCRELSLVSKGGRKPHAAAAGWSVFRPPISR